MSMREMTFAEEVEHIKKIQRYDLREIFARDRRLPIDPTWRSNRGRDERGKR